MWPVPYAFRTQFPSDTSIGKESSYEQKAGHQETARRTSQEGFEGGLEGHRPC